MQWGIIEIACNGGAKWRGNDGQGPPSCLATRKKYDSGRLLLRGYEDVGRRSRSLLDVRCDER